MRRTGLQAPPPISCAFRHDRPSASGAETTVGTFALVFAAVALGKQPTVEEWIVKGAMRSAQTTTPEEAIVPRVVILSVTGPRLSVHRE